MDEQLQNIFALIRKTGDRFIVVDRNRPQDAYVVMDLRSYEYLVDSIDEDMFDEEDDISRDEFDAADFLEGEDDTSEEDNFSWHSGDEEYNLDNTADYGTMEQNKKRQNRWEIPSELKESQRAGVEEEQDRYYLEAVA